MSLEIIDKLLDDWNKPDYLGLDHTLNLELLINDRDDYMKIKTRKDIEQMKYIKTAPFRISTYKDLNDYYEAFNFNKSGEFTYILESDNIDNNILLDYIKSSTKNILEIGFGTGSTSDFLLNEINADITSIDYYDQIYSWYGKSYIDEKYPNRHNLLIGLPEDVMFNVHFGQPVIFKYDLILVNFKHIKDPYLFVCRLKEYCHDNTVLVFKNICPHLELNPYLVMKKLILDGILILEEHIKLGKNYNNGMSILKFGSSNKMPSFQDIESGLPVTIFKRIISDSTEDKFSDNSVIQTYVRKLINAGIKIDKDFIKLIKQKFNINI